MLRIVRGEPSDEELAALIAVVATLANAVAQPLAAHCAWADPAHRLRTPLQPGPGAWRRSALPHYGASGSSVSS
ncbi:MAG: acyl-CoA carboxylase subunit epsilon [Actinomycetota bacterium]|nr:acyl-CoA carboxylase subunit epsilon [Actinomycetota bacterium]